MAKSFTLEEVWHYHRNCHIVLYWKPFKNGDSVPGLYCKESGSWIQWLDIKTADALILKGVEQVLEQPVKTKYQHN